MLRLDINLVFTIINLIVLFVLMRIFLFKPVNNIIAKREEAIANSLMMRTLPGKRQRI